MRLALILVGAVCASSALAQQLDLDDSSAGVCHYILNRWAAAEGNPAEGYALDGYETVQEVTFSNGQPAVALHVVETSAGHVRVESTSPATGTLVQAFDGRIGWRSHSQWGMGPMSKGDIQTLVAQARLDLAQDAIRSHPVTVLLPSETLDGHPCYVIRASGRDPVDETWYFDKESHQRVKRVRPAAGGAPEMEMSFSDFRPTGGLTLPYTIRITAGTWAMTIRRSRLLINPPVDEAGFVLTMDQLHEINTVKAILDRHASVYGNAGEDQPPDDSRVVRWTVESSISGLREQVTVSFRAPHLVRYEVDTPGMGRTWQVTNGQMGWEASDILGFRELKPAEIANVLGQANSYRLPRLADRLPLRRLVGERIVNGRHAVAVALSSLAGPDGTYYFDRDTGRLLRYVPPRGRDTAGTVIDFSDFRAADGLEIPYVTTIRNYAGQTVTRLQSIETGVPLADDLFVPPAADH